MASILKTAIVLGREIANKLGIRFGDPAVLPAALTVTSGVDASTPANPTITIGAGVTGGQNVFIRFLEFPSIGVNSIGLTQDSYGPHTAQIAIETSATANRSFVFDTNLLRVLIEVFRFGPRVELYMGATGTAPTVATITAGNLALTIDDLRHPTTSAL